MPFAAFDTGIVQVGKVLADASRIVHIHRRLLACARGNVEYHYRTLHWQLPLTNQHAIALP